MLYTLFIQFEKQSLAGGIAVRELKIEKNDAGQRLDKFITKTLGLPTSLLYKSIRLKKIKVNRKRAENNTLLCEGDTVQCFLAEEFFAHLDSERGEARLSLDRITPRLDIVYEDENIMLLNKRPGVSVHEDENGAASTLIAHIQAYLYQKGEYDPRAEQSFAPALCNRIDRNTSGIVIAAKNAEALRIMNEKIKARQIDKFYLAAVHGIPRHGEKTIHAYLTKDSDSNTVRIYDNPGADGAKKISTKYRVIATRGSEALLEVELLTGRTHQIRAHLAHIGHPLLGDGKYGINKEDRARGYKYQALCSYRLRFSFDDNCGILGYLRGKEFSIPKDEIYFTKEFFR